MSILEFNFSQGELKYVLDVPFEYAKNGEVVKATSLILREPVKSSQVDCIRLSQVISKISAQAMKAFFGTEKMMEESPEKKKEEGGEELKPYHKRKDFDENAVLESADSYRTMLMNSETDPEEFLKVGSKLFTTRYSSADNRRLCVIDDENQTPMTASIFTDLAIQDQIMLVCLYAIFFDLSSTGQRKTMSSRGRE